MTVRERSGSLARVAGAILIAIVFAGCAARAPVERAPLPFRQAEDSFKLGHYDRAVHGYRIFIDSNEAPDLVPLAYFKLARAEFRLGHMDRCIAALDELQRRYPKQEWRQVDELRGNAEYARGNPVSAVYYWERAMMASDRPRRVQLRQQIADAVRPMDADMVARVRAVVIKDETRQLIDSVAGVPAAAVGAPAAVPGERQPTVGSARPAPTPASPGTMPLTSPKLGVLLPLSGKYAAYGKRSLAGIEMAMRSSGIELVVRDTAGESQNARAAFDELAAMPEIRAVIGPLRSQEAQSVSPRAERAGVPMLSLAQNQSPSSRYVLQTAMTHEMQAATLAEYAINAIGLRTFGVLFPRDAYGMALSDAFKDEVVRRGGRVVGAIAYEPGAPEFSIEVLTLERWVDGDGLQAVFIPDFAATAGVLSRSLRASRPGVALLGSNGWNDPGQLGELAEALDGAVFVDGFFVGSQRAATQRFLGEYRAVHGDAPGVLEAQAYDAASVLRHAFDSGATSSRDELLDAVRSMGRFDGAAGALTFGDEGVARQLFVLKLDGRRIRELTAEERTRAASAGRLTPPAVTVP